MVGSALDLRISWLVILLIYLTLAIHHSEFVRVEQILVSMFGESLIHRSVEGLRNGIYTVELEEHIIWRTIEPFYLNHESCPATAP